ncbi:MAG: archaellin/type IV pilin N-terminal domain-containing protein [Candidatus Aenigmatarchaeota archaeon]
MKGISAIIATILMLMITIALAGTAYMYMSGMLTSNIQGIEVVWADCSSDGKVSFSVKNIGTNNITDIRCDQSQPPGDTSCTLGTGTFPIIPGNTTIFTETCAGTGARNCVYKLIPSAGKPVGPISVLCS